MASFEISRIFSTLLSRATGHPPQLDELKRRFDSRAAAHLDSARQVIFGMPGACESVFRASPSALKVFHAVDTHPRAHNDALLAHYAPAELSGELYSSRLVSRIENELRLADLVLVPSQIVFDEMKANGVDEEKLCIVRYGVDLSRFVPLGRLSLPSRSRPQLLYVGQISRRKGVPFLVRAADGLDVDVDLVGPIVDRALLRELPSNVRYLGVLPHDEVANALAHADAFAFASVEDACPLALIEAAGAGLPVVTTSAAGSSEMLDSRELTLVPPGDVVALRQAMAEVVPLTEAERTARAHRMRASSGNNRVKDWAEYAEQVTNAIHARRVFLRQGTDL